MKVIVALRHKSKISQKTKVRRISKLRTSMEQMRARLKRDLRSSDPSRFLTALAVSMLDATGQDALSAKKKNVKFEDDAPHQVNLKLHRGRSSIIANPVIVRALRDAYEAVDDEQDNLFKHDTGEVTPASVEDYLGKFGLTSEQVRGFNASQTIQDRLLKVRASGGALPSHWKSKQKVLRTEFSNTIAAVAADFGLAAETLQEEYLMPGLEASYLKDGSFTVREASAQAMSLLLRTSMIDL